MDEPQPVEVECADCGVTYNAPYGECPSCGSLNVIYVPPDHDDDDYDRE